MKTHIVSCAKKTNTLKHTCKDIYTISIHTYHTYGKYAHTHGFTYAITKKDRKKVCNGAGVCFRLAAWADNG